MSGPTPVDQIARARRYRGSSSLIPTTHRLDGNEGRSPPQGLLERLADLSPALVRDYPQKSGLEAQLATRFGISAQQVIVTNGADDALDRVARCYASGGRTLLTAGPTFEMIERFVRIAGGSYREVPWRDHAFPLEALSGAVDDEVHAIAVVTPNNPTGRVASVDAIRTLSERFPTRLIVADLAYIEFADRDPTPELLTLPNVVITRTLSKAYSFAGARVGYAMSGRADIIEHIGNAGGPFPVSGLSLALASMWIEEGAAHVAASRACVQRERETIFSALRDCGARPVASQANFVWARPDAPGFFRDALASIGIAIRAFADKPALADSVRITCPQDDALLARLQVGIASSLRPQQLWVEPGTLSSGEIARLARTLPVHLAAPAPSRGGWYLGRQGFERAREVGMPSFGYAVDVEEAQRAGAAGSFAGVDAVEPTTDAQR
ncbi:MAG: histidinol-phosphate transaminase [Myxococcota bacterium]